MADKKVTVRITGEDELSPTLAKANAGLAKLREPLGALAVQATGLNGALGGAVSRLGEFAIGGGITGALLGGVAAIGYAFSSLREESVKTKEKLDDLLKSANDFLDLKADPARSIFAEAGGISGRSAELRRQRAALEAANGKPVTQFVDKVGYVTVKGPDNTEAIRQLTVQIDNLDAQVAELNKDGLKVRDDAGKAARDSLAKRDLMIANIFTKPQLAAGSQGLRGDFFSRLGAAPGLAEGTPQAFINSNLLDNIDIDSLLNTARFYDQLRENLALGIGNAFTDAITQGIETAISAGSIGEGFKAFAGALLSGLGSAMIEFGKASLLAAIGMQTILKSLASLLPGGAIVASLAMIAIGATLRGVAQRAFGGGATGVSSYSGAGYSTANQSTANDRGPVEVRLGDRFDPKDVRYQDQLRALLQELGLTRQINFVVA